jgi:hypothetical protein
MTNDKMREVFEASVKTQSMSKVSAERYLSKTDDGNYFDPITDMCWELFQAGYQAREDEPCPYVVTSGEGTSYCRLAESSVKARDAEVAELMGALEGMLEMFVESDQLGDYDDMAVVKTARFALAKHKQEG